MPKDLPTSIRLSRQLKEELLKAARLQGYSLSRLIARVLQQYIDWAKKVDK